MRWVVQRDHQREHRRSTSRDFAGGRGGGSDERGSCLSVCLFVCLVHRARVQKAEKDMHQQAVKSYHTTLSALPNAPNAQVQG